jgi:serine/threonine-protein kinase
MIGQVLSGNYRLTDLVGSGGYADVYLARDLRSNTIVAVKILHAHVARDPDIAARFEREAALARRLETPHIAQILDSSHDATSPPFIVMEFVQGLTVAELIRRHGPFPIPEALHIVDQLLSALGAAHALGIVHRDIKPQNMMVDAGRRLKVLDFGVARVAGAGTMTATGHLLGTPEYMAAEQVDGQPVDHRADLYAAGAVLYQLVSGRPPYIRYADTDLWELIRRVRTEPPPPIKQLRPETPPAIVAAIERAMAKDPAQRFQSAYEMQQALAAAGGMAPPLQRQAPPVTPPQAVTRVLPVPSNLLPPGPGAPPMAPPNQGPYPPSPAPLGGFTPAPPMQTRTGPMSPSRRSGLHPWQIVGLGVAALLLVIVGVALGRIMPGVQPPTPTPAPVAAATSPPSPVVAVAPSPAASGQAAPASVGSPVAARSPVAAASPLVASSPVASPSPAVAVKPVSPSPSPTVPPQPTYPPGVLLADDFDQPNNRRLSTVSSRPDDFTFAYDGGEYVIKKVNATLPVAPSITLAGTYENTIIAVDVRIMGDAASRYGFVVCRDQSTNGQSKQYRASVVPNERRLTLARWDSGTGRTLGEVRNDPSINPGNGQNRLELRCAGAKISAAVNGKVLATADDLTLTRGAHAMGTGLFAEVEGTVEARFDNLEVRAP